MTLKWWGPTGTRTHSAWLFWLQCQRITPRRHNTFNIEKCMKQIICYNNYFIFDSIVSSIYWTATTRERMPNKKEVTKVRKWGRHVSKVILPRTWVSEIIYDLRDWFIILHLFNYAASFWNLSEFLQLASCKISDPRLTFSTQILV